MDLIFISAAMQNMLNAWNIRGLMIVSLCMQLVLALAAPFRWKTSNGFFILVVWSAYVLAHLATFSASSLISNAGCPNSENYDTQVHPDVLAFWTACILVHLGCPDAITSFSLEDNALWLRLLVGVNGKLFVFLYIFVKRFPQNKLLVPTTLIFVAGVIKFGERTLASYLASLENLKKSIKKTTRYQSQDFHDISKGLIVDITPDISECNHIRELFLTQSPRMTIKMIFSELHFLYEVLYTKIKLADSRWGMLTRGIVYYSALAAFILFSLADKQEFHGVDIAISYALLWGVFILHISNLLMLSKSYFHDTFTLKEFILLTFGHGFLLILVVYALYRVSRFLVRGSTIERFLDRQWSEKMGSFNLLSYCLKQGATTQRQKPAGFRRNKFAEMRHTSREDFKPELFDFVLEKLKKKTEGTFDMERMTKVYEARGDWALEEKGCRELKPYINDFEYDNTLFIWHVATEICYNIEGDVGDDNKMKGFSKVLSDYMMYLLVRRPELISLEDEIPYNIYEDTCVELKRLRSKNSVPNMQSFCKKILEEHADITEPTNEEHADITKPTDEELADFTEHTDEEYADVTEPTDEKHADVTETTDEGHRRAHSVLKDSCRLVRRISEENNRWEVMCEVWMELLSYAASHCRADSHAQQLSKGGEFITIVWMLMVFIGVRA